MNRHRRKVTEGMNFVNDIFEDVKDIFDGDSSSEESTKLPPKYRIDTFRKQKNSTLLDNVQRFLDGNNESGMLIPYLHWSFNASFFTLFISMLINFMGLVLIFTGFIVLAATLKPTCITPNSGTNFADAFALSWMTFTTVVSFYCNAVFLSFRLLIISCELHLRVTVTFTHLLPRKNLKSGTARLSLL